MLHLLHDFWLVPFTEMIAKHQDANEDWLLFPHGGQPSKRLVPKKMLRYVYEFAHQAGSVFLGFLQVATSTSICKTSDSMDCNPTQHDWLMLAVEAGVSGVAKTRRHRTMYCHTW